MVCMLTCDFANPYTYVQTFTLRLLEYTYNADNMGIALFVGHCPAFLQVTGQCPTNMARNAIEGSIPSWLTHPQRTVFTFHIP